MADKTTPIFAPIVAGAVYSRERFTGVTEEVLCIAAVNDRGTIKGLFRRFGYADETHTEGSEEMVDWKIVYNPRELSEVVENLKASPKKAAVITEGAKKPRRTTRARS